MHRWERLRVRPWQPRALYGTSLKLSSLSLLYERLSIMRRKKASTASGCLCESRFNPWRVCCAWLNKGAPWHPAALMPPWQQKQGSTVRYRDDWRFAVCKANPTQILEGAYVGWSAGGVVA